MPYRSRLAKNKYQAAWMERRRQDWFSENGPCVDCGSWNRLELDHVDASTKVSHRIWSWSRGRMAQELAKCVARCFSCHRRKTNTAGEINYARGHAVKGSRLTEQQVKEIRSLLGEGLTPTEVAERYKVSRPTISKILHRRNWKHI